MRAFRWFSLGLILCFTAVAGVWTYLDIASAQTAPAPIDDPTIQLASSDAHEIAQIPMGALTNAANDSMKYSDIVDSSAADINTAGTNTVDNSPADDDAAAVPEMSQNAPAAKDNAKLVPSAVIFPRFDLTCEIVPVGLDVEDRMAVASSHKIATWYMYGASPGQSGNAILASHVRWQGKSGFFSILPQLELGEEVLVDFANGSRKTFEVTLNEFYYLEEMPAWVMHLGGESRITLITCAGRHLSSINDSEARTIVLLREKKA